MCNTQQKVEVVKEGRNRRLFTLTNKKLYEIFGDCFPSFCTSFGLSVKN